MFKKIFSIKNNVYQFSQKFQHEASKNVDLAELHNNLLEMYKDIIAYCEELNLNVFAVGGTALGAIRHQGFIPWDDDIDLGMLRADYIKFIENFNNSFLSEKYILKVPNYTKKNPNRFLQLYKRNTILKTLHNGSNPEWQMLFLDIFPYDSVSDNLFFRQLTGYSSDFLMLIASCVGLAEMKNEQVKSIFYSTVAGKLNYNIRMCIGKCFSFKSHSEWFDVIDRFVSNSDPNTHSITSAMGSKHYLGEIIDRSTFLPLRSAMFGTLEIKVPGRVEDYLTMLYGNTYMQVPDVKYTHSVLFFDKVESQK